MAYELVITPETEADILMAFTWYEQKRTGLGHDFLLQMDAGFRSLERNPLIHSEKYASVRCYLIRRFPYKVFYRIETGKIIILGVISGRRNPEWIKQRVQG